MSGPPNMLPEKWTGLSASVRSLAPEALRVGTGLGVELWQLLGVLVGAVLAWAASVALAAAVVFFGKRISARTATSLDDELWSRAVGPARLLFAAILMRPLPALFALPSGVSGAFHSGARALLVLALFWGLLRAVSVVSSHMGASAWAKSRPGSQSLLALGGGLAKVGTIALGIITVLSELRYPVASILAGLGLGGLALALAAQKTVENLFGAFSIAADQPFRVGDFVRVEDFVGTVESIGMRSTRFRTLDRTLISIPNGKLADARLETFAARDRILLSCTVSLRLSTTAPQMRQVLHDLEATLRTHPKIWTDAVVVKFKAFGVSSLDIEVMAWFLTSEWSEFQQIRQETLLQFMDVVERAGASLAIPSQLVHVAQDAAQRQPT